MKKDKLYAIMALIRRYYKSSERRGFVQLKESHYKTSGGIDIYSYKNPALNSFYISLFVKAGCMYEDERESGISHFFEHIAIRNVNAAMGGELYPVLDGLGVDFNASTFSEMIQFYVSGAKENFGEGAKLITSIFSPIILTSEDISAERRRIKAEIRESDDKNTLASFTNKIVFEGTPLSYSIVGTNSSVDRVNKASLERFRKKVFTKENVFFYVTGAFCDRDIQLLGELADKWELPSGDCRRNIAPVPEKFGKRDAGVYIKSADYTMVRFSFDLDMSRLSVPVTDLLYDILLAGYTSKLFMEMSEKRGLFYDTSGAVERYRNIGSFYFSFEVKERELYGAVKLVCELLASLKQKALDEEECMKAGYVTNAFMLCDDARESNFTLAYDNHIMELGYSGISERRDAYASVSGEDIREAAEMIFTPDNLTVTVKGNKKRIDPERLHQIIKGELI